MARWSAAGADLVLGGHIHLPFVVPLHENDPTLPRRVWAVQAGTAVSTRVRDGAGNSVNLVRCDGAAAKPCCTVERWNYVAAARRFECAVVSELALDRSNAAG